MAAAAPWPRSFRLNLPERTGSEKLAQFSQNLFRGPANQPVQLLYSDNLVTSEVYAQLFLNEPVLGFDLEWIYPAPKSPTLQERVSLIQVASEDKVGLFHIGLHDGQRADELIAPSLRQLIEDPNIRITGQSIMGDCARLHEHFQLQPRGLSELSYLHCLITPSYRNDLKTQYIPGGLKTLVETHFPGLTLRKDSGMHENWTSPLTTTERDYAAADVYASLMVFHCMNAKRSLMQPCPPLPRDIEEYMPMEAGYPVGRWIKLEPLVAGGGEMPARHFFWLHEGLEEDADLATDLDDESQLLYTGLTSQRDFYARNIGLPRLHVATDSALRNVAKEKPQTFWQCVKLKGLGLNKHREIFAELWVNTVNQFLDQQRVRHILEFIDLNVNVTRTKSVRSNRTEDHPKAKDLHSTITVTYRKSALMHKP